MIEPSARDIAYCVSGARSEMNGHQLSSVLDQKLAALPPFLATHVEAIYGLHEAGHTAPKPKAPIAPAHTQLASTVKAAPTPSAAIPHKKPPRNGHSPGLH